ncbi:MAG: leucyl aminopeptidase, partial [Rhodobacteraceae bacterium]|nr:leucyl aminopeptidase [Paracoccaceae bacterium]
MTRPITPHFVKTNLDLIDEFEGKIVCFMTPAGGLDQLSRRVNKLARGALIKFSESETFKDMPIGAIQTMDFPAHIKADSLIVVKLGRRVDSDVARNAGALAIKSIGKSDAMLLAGANHSTVDVAQGMILRAYDFNDHKSGERS